MTMTRGRLAAFALSLLLIAASTITASAQPPAPVQPPDNPPAAAGPAARSFDGYDVGAIAANVLWVPFKAGTCAISAGAGALAFIFSLGAAAPWTESAFDEGCVRKWVLTGDDFRPAPTARYAGQ